MDRRVKLGGRYWRLRSVDHKTLPCNYDGICDHSEAKKKTIRIANNLAGRDLLDTLIHEMLHACLPHLNEEAVETTATDIARILHKLGWEQTGNTNG